MVIIVIKAEDEAEELVKAIDKTIKDQSGEAAAHGIEYLWFWSSVPEQFEDEVWNLANKKNDELHQN